MEYTYQIIPEHQLVIEIVTGEVTVEELIRKTETVFTDPAYKPGFIAMMDFRQAVSRMSKVELYGYTSLVSETEFFGISKAAVITHDPGLVALSQIFKQRMPNQETFETFSTIKAAAKFVGDPIVLNYLSDD
jgi:hypothetical protein